MTEAEWLICTDEPQWMLDSIPGRVSDRKLRLLAVACCRTIRSLLKNADLSGAVEVAERYADGRAGLDELTAAHDRCSRLALSLYAKNPTERQVVRWAEAVAACRAAAVPAEGDSMLWNDVSQVVWHVDRAAGHGTGTLLSALVRDVVGNPFRPFTPDPRWLTATVIGLASAVYAERAFDRLPILADALQDAACDSADILTHLRSDGPHVRGCWAVDLILGRR